MVIYNFIGIKKVLDLINGKLRSESKLDQINRLLKNSKFKNKFIDYIDFKLNLSNDFNNHWLSGFSDADASFQIKISRLLRKRRKKKIDKNLKYD